MATASISKSTVIQGDTGIVATMYVVTSTTGQRAQFANLQDAIDWRAKVEGDNDEAKYGGDELQHLLARA